MGAYADALALLMDWKDTNTPLTIAINGPWGSGKTSLAKMTEARLPIGSDWDASHVICWFDAWANDDAPNLGAAFAAAVAKEVNKHRRWWVRLAMPLPSVMLSPEQRWRRRIWFGVLAVALAAAAVFWPTGGSLLTPMLHPGETVSTLGHGTAAARLAWPLLVIAVIALAQRLAPSIQGVARWIDSPGSEAARGSMQDANRQLRRLIDQALRHKRRLMIFVDNLERCRPPRAVEVCEVVSHLVGQPQVVTVLIGDMDTIALSAEVKYAALESVSPSNTAAPGTAGSRPAGAYGRAYLEKLIQIQLRLPPPVPKELREMLVPVADGRPAFPPPASKRKPQSPATLARYAAAALGSLSRPQAWIVAGSLTAIAAGVVLLVIYYDPITSFVKRTATPGAVVGVIVAGSFVWGVIKSVYDQIKEMSAKRRRATVDDAVSSVVGPTETTLRPAAVKEAAERANNEQVNNIDENEIRRRMRQNIISPRNKQRAQLDRAVLDMLPLSPRAAKRMFNHAHLLLDIGVERRLFSGQRGLKPSQLAAWVALTERWPSVAEAIINDPTLLGRLEKTAQETTNQTLRLEQLTAIETDMGITGLDSSLLDHLRRSDSLLPCVRSLVNFSPATD
jgi:hypothetical protein